MKSYESHAAALNELRNKGYEAGPITHKFEWLI